MRRNLMLGAGALAAAMMVLSLAAAGGATASTGRAGDESFTVFAFPRDKLITVSGTSPKQLRKGDELIIDDRLTGTHRVHGHYRVIGHDAGVCVVTHAGKKNNARLQCLVTVVLPDGNITVQGKVALLHGRTVPGTLAITGGTGEFTGAGGTVFTRDRKHFSVYTFNVT